MLASASALCNVFIYLIVLPSSRGLGRKGTRHDTCSFFLLTRSLKQRLLSNNSDTVSELMQKGLLQSCASAQDIRLGLKGLLW